MKIGFWSSLASTLDRRIGRAEFWIFSSSAEPLDATTLKQATRLLPGDLFGEEGLDIWTFSDVRFRLGDGDRETMSHAFDPRTLDGALGTSVAVVGAERVTKIVFAGPIAAEGFPLGTVTGAALAAARHLAASLMWDAVARRAWEPRLLAEACRAHGITSPTVHLNEESVSELEVTEVRISGFEKRGLPDLQSCPFPSDLAPIAHEALRRYAAARWRGEGAQFSHESFGDTFLVTERRRYRRPSLVRIFRRQERG